MNPRSGRKRAILTVVAFLAACGDLPEPRTCSASSPCAAGSWCRSGQCVANAAPVAEIEVPATPASNRPLLFSGGSSHDSDPGDAVASWSWTLAAPEGTTGCDPLPSAATGADLSVVFPCAGDHRVTLRVTDTMGLESAPRTVLVHVQPTLDPPQVTVGADVAVDHRCDGVPLACRAVAGTASAIPLAAAGVTPPGTTFSYRWSVELPPELSSRPAPRVTFAPDATSPSPQVRIETDGTAIAGRYTFVVELTDGRGMIAVGRQHIDVGNRPPIVSGGGPLALGHAYEPSTRSFVAAGLTPVATWTDPDGDPVAPVGFASSRAGDGDNVLDVQDLGDHARVTVVVAYRQEADAAYLLGPGVRRRVELWVADANGARGSAGWDVTVTNRPPRVTAAVPAASVDHAFEAAAQRYAAQAALSTWVDDDGDPISLSVAGDPQCATVEERQGTAFVTCSRPWTGRADVQAFAGVRSLSVASRDPFEAGASQATTLEIRNRPPRVLASSVPLTTTCRSVPACCAIDPATHACPATDWTYAPVAATATLLADDDGDPLDVTLVPSDPCLAAASPPQPCPASGCDVGLSMCGDLATCGAWSPSAMLAVGATDGAVRVAADVPVQATCGGAIAGR